MIALTRHITFGLSMLVLFGLSACSDDYVDFTNVDSSDNAVLISNSGQNTLTDTYLDNAQHSVKVGPRSGTIPVVAFARDSQPIYAPMANWSAANNAQVNPHHMPVFETPTYDMEVMFWIVGDNTLGLRTSEVHQAVAVANDIYAREKVGIQIKEHDISDFSGLSNGRAHRQFSCKDDQTIQSLKNDVGYLPGHLNVYLADTVDVGNFPVIGGYVAEGAGATCACDFTMIGIGELAPSQTLAHEIGHALSLTHFDNSDQQTCNNGHQAPPPNFQADTTNLMTPGNLAPLNPSLSGLVTGINNWVLTEGQIFRMNFDGRSIKNYVYNDIHYATQDCDFADSNANCPPIWKRIWADNMLPPN